MTRSSAVGGGDAEETELAEAPMGPCCNLHIVATIRAAAAAAKRDDDWKDSGVQEMLLNALKVAEQGDCSGAVASAMGVLAFLQGAAFPAFGPPSSLLPAADSDLLQYMGMMQRLESHPCRRAVASMSQGRA